MQDSASRVKTEREIKREEDLSVVSLPCRCDRKSFADGCTDIVKSQAAGEAPS